MFKFLKKMVGISTSPESIPFSVLNQWFDKKVNETDLKDDLKEIISEIDSSIKVIESELKALTNVAPENATEEQIEVIAEHKKYFLSKTQHSLNELTSMKVSSPESIVDYNEALVIALKHIKSLKQFEVIKKFFSQHAEAIENELSALEDCQKNLLDCIERENGVNFVIDIKKRIADINKKEKSRFELTTRLENEERKKNEIENYKSKIETEIDDLKTTYEYQKFDQVISKKIQLERELERERDLISPHLSILSSLFKMYDKFDSSQRITAKNYSSNPIDALDSDQGLSILSLLHEVSSRLTELEADEKKRIKYQTALNSLSREVLKKYLEKSGTINSALRDIRRQTTTNTTILKQEDFAYKLRHVKEQLRTINETKASCERAISELSTEKDLLNLEKQLQSLSKVLLR